MSLQRQKAKMIEISSHK